MKDVIIIGAGTAGLTAAIYALRAGKSVLVLEQSSYGGQIINTPHVENYPGIERISGYEFASGLFRQAEKLGMEYRNEKVTDIREEENREAAGGKSGKIVETTERNYRAKAVILATGAKNRPLGIEKEAEFIGRGISYCATCDGMFFRGKKVAVVGGGNTALEDAAFLSNYCEKVYLVHRREGFRGEDKLVNELREKENVEFLLNKTVQAIEGEMALQAVLLLDKNSGKESRLEISGLFVAIGQIPENEVFAGLVELDEGGYIVAGEDCRTNVDGIFAAGDCRKKTVRQLTTAAADGAVAALAAAQL
ncbi:MAG: thioredoxin-disulfide reductase [Lachnospiraceae bacterium]|jgi:thioredoxin reductase (NADPH)|nr:thioredoxin-disulfide reductase [Lachnospiraceae bacterium]